MADAPTFTLGSLTLELYDDGEGIDFGTAAVDFGENSNPLSRLPAETIRTVTGFREQSWPIRLRGVASIDETKRENAVRQLVDLETEMRKATNTLTITRRGSAVQTVYRVVQNPQVKKQLTRLLDRGGVFEGRVTLRVQPWAEGTAVAQTLATSLATPNVLDAVFAGAEPSPLTLTATRGFSGSGLQTLVVGRIPTTFDLADLLLLAMDASAPNWDAFTATSGYVNDTDNTRICTSTAYRSMYWDDALPLGRYRWYLKTRVQTGGKGWLAQARASNEPSRAPVAVTDTDWRYVTLGDFASDGYTVPRIVGKCREAANGILVDWAFPFPLDYGGPFFFHDTSHAVHSVTSEELDANMVLTSGAARSARRYVSGPGLCAVGAARLAALACDANGNLRQPSVTLAATHTPLYDHFVPTPEV